MAETLAVRIKEIKPDIRESTIKTYLYNIQRLKNYLDAEDFDKVIKNKPAYVMKRLKQVKNYNKRKPLNLACIIYAKVINAKRAERIYKTYLREKLNPEYKQNHFNQQPSEKEKKSLISYEELVKIKDNPENPLWFRLFLALYFEYPFRNCWCSVSLNDTGDNNSLTRTQETKMKLILRKYKTSKLYGVMEYTIDQENILKLLNEYIGDRKDGFLFINSRGGGYTGSGFITKLQKQFQKYYPNKRISTTLLRKILLSHDLENLPSLKQLEEDRIKHSRKYLNSLSLAQLVYRKI